MKKKILIAIAAILVVILGFGAFMQYTMHKETSQMTPLATGTPIAEGLGVIQDQFSNVYFIQDSLGFIAVDAGMDPENVLKQMQNIDIQPNMVHTVLLTHSDNDHVASLDLFDKADFYVALKEKPLVTGEQSRFGIFNNQVPQKEFKYLKDGDEFLAGATPVKAYLTPGHTPGSMCYLIAGKYLFTGDTHSLKDGKFGVFNETFNMDTPRSLESQKIIQAIPGVKIYLSGHYGMMRKGK